MHVDNKTTWVDDNTAGSKLKTTTDWNGKAGNGQYDFKALPGGDMSNDKYYSLGKQAFFWTATEAVSPKVYAMYMAYSIDALGVSSYDKSTGFSVRCIKNAK